MVIAFSVAAGGVLLLRSHASCGGPPRQDVTLARAKQIAYDAVPRWSVEHPDRVCPSLDELAPYLNDDALLDAWGDRFELRCSRDKPRVVVRSYGEDQRADTEDDIRSTDP
jgi:hypothetical protein